MSEENKQSYQDFEILDATDDITLEDDSDQVQADGLQQIPQTSEDSVLESEVKVAKFSSPSNQNYQQQFVNNSLKKAFGNDNVRQYDNFHEQLHDHNLPSPERKSSHKHHMDDEDSEDSSGNSDEAAHSLDYKKKVLEGSFLPAMVMLKLNKISVEDIIDPNQGLRLMHYACFFGKIKALKTLVEVYHADLNSIDYRGQTPLHVASISGELGPIIYLCSKGDNCNKEVKDNALMTPIMNAVSSGSESSFIYLYFEEGCDLKNVDANGFTLMHLAAKSNSVHIAKLLQHLYKDSINQDDSYMAINLSTEKVSENTPEKNKSPLSDRDNTPNSSRRDNLIFFDIDRQNTQGQSPIFMTVNANMQMMKFLMRNGCSITQKDSKGDNIRDHIYRYMRKDTVFFDQYVKEENRLLIERIYQANNLPEFKETLKINFRWNLKFVKLFSRLSYSKLSKHYHLQLLLTLYALIYLLHWVLMMNGSHFIVSFLIHFFIALNTIVVCLFNRKQPGLIEKMHINRDRDQNLVGQLLHLMQQRQLHKIEELSNRYCYDCLIIRSKHASHCKDCNSCVNFRQKHSKFFGKCIGSENTQLYYYFISLNIIILLLFTYLSLNSFNDEIQSTKWIFQLIEGIMRLWDFSRLIFAFSFIVFTLYLYAIDDFIWFTVAVSRNMTVQQLKNIWAYKYCYDVKTNADDKNYFTHKYIPFWKNVQNVGMLLLGKNQYMTKKGVKRIKKNVKDGKYVDLETTSRSVKAK